MRSGALKKQTIPVIAAEVVRLARLMLMGRHTSSVAFNLMMIGYSARRAALSA